MPVTEAKAPGLVKRTRCNGASVYYWCARKDLIKLGYLPKMVRLHGDDLGIIVARCHALQAEMLQWAVAQRAGPTPTYDGTFASLVKYYEAHSDSPYHGLRPKTQAGYSNMMKLLMAHKGKRRVDAVNGGEVGRWYKEMTEAKSKGTAALMMRILRAILSFGASQRFVDCKLLRPELTYVKFAAGAARKERLTYAQVISFKETAREMGAEWMGLCLLMQFEMALRRRDVIGEWIRDGKASGIRRGEKVWRDGATWANIDKDGVFSKLVSKTRDTSEETAAHAIADYPELEAELACIPLERRIGPIVINPETGLPPTEQLCRRWFRRIARAAGIPDNVQQMDARAGANTEARESGATKEESMALLTHTQESTNDGYDREKLKRSRSAAAKRQAARAK